MVHRHRGVRRVAIIENHTREYSTRILLVEDHASFRQALASRPDVMTLVLSASLEPARFARAVEAGAAGVLHKSAAIGEVVEAVRRLKSGEALLSPAEVIQMLRMVSRKRQEEYEAQRAIEKLTPREKQVLQALGEGLD